MSVAVTGTVVGYDVNTGKKLFTHVNRPVKLTDGTSSLPNARDTFSTDGKQYRVIGIRKGSTETYFEMDLQEEQPVG